MPYLETLRKAAGLGRVQFEACWALSGTTFGNVGGNQVDSVWPCLEREAKGGNRDLKLNSLEVVVDPLRVNMVSEGSYTKKRAEGWEQWGKQLYFKEEKRKRDSRNGVRRGGIQEGKSKQEESISGWSQDAERWRVRTTQVVTGTSHFFPCYGKTIQCTLQFVITMTLCHIATYPGILHLPMYKFCVAPQQTHLFKDPPQF